jgi:hypothetical protein
MLLIHLLAAPVEFSADDGFREHDAMEGESRSLEERLYEVEMGGKGGGSDVRPLELVVVAVPGANLVNQCVELPAPLITHPDAAEAIEPPPVHS